MRVFGLDIWPPALAERGRGTPGSGHPPGKRQPLLVELEDFDLDKLGQGKVLEPSVLHLANEVAKLHKGALVFPDHGDVKLPPHIDGAVIAFAFRETL